MKQYKLYIWLLFFLTSCLNKNKLSLINEAGLEMQNFIICISEYAKQFKTNFIVIPQNGIELSFNNLEQRNGINTHFLKAIDGFGIEELFYKGKFAVDSERNFMIEKIKPYKKIFVSDYISNNNEINDAYDRIYSLGYLCFVRTKKNYDYKEIPPKIPYENDSDISDINCVQNFLYIINFEKFATKNEVIQAIASTNFDFIIMDLFYDGNEFTASDLKKLKTKANGGKRLVISYVNIGAAEKFRYYWRSEWNSKKPSWITKKYKGYKDEYWVKFWAKEWQDIIYGNNNSYVKKIIDAGFDGVYLDNVEAYYYLFK